jgi:hypothetical protein
MERSVHPNDEKQSHLTPPKVPISSITESKNTEMVEISHEEFRSIV